MSIFQCCHFELLFALHKAYCKQFPLAQNPTKNGLISIKPLPVGKTLELAQLAEK